MVRQETGITDKYTHKHTTKNVLVGCKSVIPYIPKYRKPQSHTQKEKHKTLLSVSQVVLYRNTHTKKHTHKIWPGAKDNSRERHKRQHTQKHAGQEQNRHSRERHTQTHTQKHYGQ